ncbi:hypothetical protein TruAng_007627 [Truncatella angustata]|nr:hypothetical protein TruAng_007627 [Truncatella angustata]
MAKFISLESRAFPKDYFVQAIVRLLDTIEHKDTNYTHHERVDRLRYTYAATATHFAQPQVYQALKFKHKKLEAGIRTIALLVVDCWVSCSKETMAALAIYFTYTLILDDSEEDPQQMTETFFKDLMVGRKQRHPWLRLMNEHLPNLLSHYGPYGSLNIYRSTIDFFEGCWIEQHNFKGYPGNEDYPEFLRRMNGLGHVVGSTIFPAEKFDETKYFREITTSVCQLECWMAWTNDLISFYKEFDDPRDQTSLINNYCHVGGLTLQEGLEKLTHNTLRVSKQIKSVFADKDEGVANAMSKFMHGYVTWHLCDKRYRVNEIHEGLRDDGGVTTKFCRYYEEAQRVGGIDPAEWTGPTFLELIKEQRGQERSELKNLLRKNNIRELTLDVTQSLVMAFMLSVLTCIPYVVRS